MADSITLSVIKADVGGLCGHGSISPALMEVARDELVKAVSQNLLIDGEVAHCGDDLELIMTHRHGDDAKAMSSRPQQRPRKRTSSMAPGRIF